MTQWAVVNELILQLCSSLALTVNELFCKLPF